MTVGPMRIRTVVSSLLILILTGCNVFGPQSCTTLAPPAVSVSVDHAESGAPLDDALIVAVDGSYADSVRSVTVSEESAWVGLASGRPGTYTIHVEKSGFLAWIREDVTATDSGCHVNTVRLHAELVPESS